MGECGIDLFYEHSPRAAQREVFAAQIALAHEHDLALVIHARDAWDDTFDVLAGEGVPDRTIFHCFTGGPDEARRCLDLGAVLSFSGIVTFPSASDAQGRRPAVPAGPDAGRDRQPVPGAGAPSGPAEPAGLGGGGGHRHRRSAGHQPGRGGLRHLVDGRNDLSTGLKQEHHARCLHRQVDMAAAHHGRYRPRRK